MSEFVPLSASGLPDGFDAATQSTRPFVSVKEQDDCIEINYMFPGFHVGEHEARVKGDVKTFKEVGISGAGFHSESGKPLLPTFGRFIQIPPGCQYSVETKVSKPTTFDGYVVTPAQENATDALNKPADFEYDPQAYKAADLYPQENVKVGDAQNLDSYRALLVHVRPLQFNASKKQLVGHSNIDVIIRLQHGGADADAEEFGNLPTDPVVNLGGFGNLVLNPQRRIAGRFEKLMGDQATSSAIRYPPTIPQFYFAQYLIIYDPNLSSAANILADWKRKKGMRVSLVSIETVGNTIAKIKEYIRTRRGKQLSFLRYVLLFGDIRAITTEEKYGQTTDYYYYTKKDPANIYDCVAPWVAGGRIPVSSLSEAMTIVNQIIKYEREPPADPEYYRRMTFAAYFQDYGKNGWAERAYIKTLETIRQHMEFLGYDVQRVYVKTEGSVLDKYKDGSPVPSDVKRAIVDNSKATEMLISECSEGQLLIAHRDHGSDQGWHRPSFSKENLGSIMSSYPSIFYSVNCLTGRFDRDPYDSFAEDLLEKNGGAPSLVAATELSGTWRNDSLMKALFDAVWPGVLPNYPDSNGSYAVRNNRLGDILNYAKMYLLVAHGINSGVRGHLEMYHLIGDPCLEMWSEVPRTLRLWARVSGDSLMIYLYPVPASARLTIWHRRRLVKNMGVSSSRITLSIRSLQLGTTGPGEYLELCASAPGHRFIQTRVRLS